MSRFIKLTVASAMLLVASFAAAPKADAHYGYGYGYRSFSYNYYVPTYYAPTYYNHCAPSYGFYGYGY